MKADRVSEVIARESEGLETPVDLIEVATVLWLYHYFMKSTTIVNRN